MKFVPAGKKRDKKKKFQLGSNDFPFSPLFFPPLSAGMPGRAGRGTRSQGSRRAALPRDEHLWELAAGARRGAGAVQPHLDTYITGIASKPKKKDKGGKTFFLNLGFFGFFFLNVVPPPAFPPAGCLDVASCAAWGAPEGWGGCQVQDGGWGQRPPPQRPCWGSHGAAPTRDPPPIQHPWVLSPTLPSCDMGTRQEGLAGGQGSRVPWGCGLEGSPPSSSRAGGSGGSGLTTRPGKSFPTWAG